MEQGQLSQALFDRLVESIDALKHEAAARKEWQTLKDATRIHTLAYRYFGSLIAEGKIFSATE